MDLHGTIAPSLFVVPPYSGSATMMEPSSPTHNTSFRLRSCELTNDTAPRNNHRYSLEYDDVRSQVCESSVGSSANSMISSMKVKSFVHSQTSSVHEASVSLTKNSQSSISESSSISSSLLRLGKVRELTRGTQQLSIFSKKGSNIDNCDERSSSINTKGKVYFALPLYVSKSADLIVKRYIGILSMLNCYPLWNGSHQWNINQRNGELFNNLLSSPVGNGTWYRKSSGWTHNGHNYCSSRFSRRGDRSLTRFRLELCSLNSSELSAGCKPYVNSSAIAEEPTICNRSIHQTDWNELFHFQSVSTF